MIRSTRGAFGAAAMLILAVFAAWFGHVVGTNDRPAAQVGVR